MSTCFVWKMELPAGVHAGVVQEQLLEVIHLASTAGSDDGYSTALGHGVQQLQVKAVLYAVRVNRVDNQLARAVFHAMLQPVQRVNAGVFAPAFGEQLELAIHRLMSAESTTH